MNPYKDLPDHCFWSRSMSQPHPSQIDPVVHSVRIERGQPIGTMGSCFAQHLSRHISRSGLDYFVAEQAPGGLDPEAVRARSYGVFSARYGNVYTVRQALQLLQRAYGEFVPQDAVWRAGDAWVDAFRPAVEPGGWSSPEAVAAATRDHLRCVRRVFEESEWLVFTLGLTEAWAGRADGAIYPTAPGVAGGSWDPGRYAFRNFSASEVSADLFEFIRRARGVNPRLKFLLTVSPVPLIATYEARHVWVSTTFSKSALRVACDEAERAFADVHYFPSYEIITSPAAAGRYYEDDLRQVTPIGVSHVMRVFTRHFIEGAGRVLPGAPLPPPVRRAADDDVVCDEELIERALQAVGVAKTR